MIGIHTFGPSGQAALDELARNYHAVRGPPASDVRSGYVSLPPPDDVLSILVIGKLQELNIGGAIGDSSQEISVTSYANAHAASESLAATTIGTPFADRLAREPPSEAPSHAEVYAAPEASSYSSPAPAASVPNVYPGGSTFTPSQLPPSPVFSPPMLPPPARNLTPWTPPIVPPVRPPVGPVHANRAVPLITMKDLNINIGGPRDNARQKVAVHVQQAGDRAGLDSEQLGRLLDEFRAALAESRLSADEARRIERHLSSIEEESQSPKPLLDEIRSSFTALSRLVQSAQAAAPALLGPLRTLAATLGFAAL